MKHRIILGIIIILLVFLFWSTDLFKNNEFWFDGIAIPLYWSLPYLIGSMIGMILLPYSFLRFWLKIMIPYFLIALVLTINTPSSCGSFFVCWDRTIIASAFSKLFLILTLIIVAFKSIQLYISSRRNKKLSK